MANKLIPIEEKLRRYDVAESGCWQWNGASDRDGYGVFGHHRGKQIRAHRASYELHIGSIGDGQLVCHKYDNPGCINPSHLFLGSPKDNTMDMIYKGRKTTLIGESHGNAKLKCNDVSEIRALRESGASLHDLATRYGVTFQHISAITLNKVRRHA